jgi:DNA-binding response OmpR family regulator
MDAAGQRASVLVVEDDDDLRASLEEALTAAGYQVLGAENGPRALTMFSQLERCGAVVLDLLLPGMGGRVFLDELRRTEKGATVPVVVATGRRNAWVPDASAVLRKPFHVDELLRTLKEVTAT